MVNAIFRSLTIPVSKARRRSVNKYEKAFVEHITRLNVEGPDFAALVRRALEAEYGGEIDNLLNGLDQTTIQDPEKLAAELFKAFGADAMNYYVTIIKYAESGRFQPEEDAEQASEEEELESLVREVETNSDQESATDPQT